MTRILDTIYKEQAHRDRLGTKYHAEPRRRGGAIAGWRWPLRASAAPRLSGCLCAFVGGRRGGLNGRWWRRERTFTGTGQQRTTAVYGDVDVDVDVDVYVDGTATDRTDEEPLHGGAVHRTSQTSRGKTAIGALGGPWRTTKRPNRADVRVAIGALIRQGPLNGPSVPSSRRDWDVRCNQRADAERQRPRNVPATSLDPFIGLNPVHVNVRLRVRGRSSNGSQADSSKGGTAAH